jgi:hypothetical protein
MNTTEALKLVGGLSQNLLRCRAGPMVYQRLSVKQAPEAAGRGTGSTCEGCYAD